jgi:RNA polymerase sigma-70 factor, ECF subfamily
VTPWLVRRQRAHRRYEVTDAARVDLEPAAAPDLAFALEQREKLVLLDQLLAALDEEQRLVFVLFELESMTGSEIALALGIPLGTVFSRLRLARVAFRAALGRHRTAEDRLFLRAGSK